jgi:uncharacterized protein (DUF1778 family)
MATRTDRVEARLAPEERERIRSAADLQHTSTSSFMVSAALEKADQVIASFRVTTVPSEYFDALFASLDDSSVITELQHAKRALDDPAFVRR